MKKILFALFVSVYFLGEISAQSLSPAQQKIKADIFAFLKKEVSNLSDYSYKEITFTYNQIKYHIELSEKDINPYFITLSAGFNLPESYKSEVVAFFTRDINLINGVKCISEDKWIRFDSEMYIKDSKAFTQVFHKMISQIEAAKNYFEDTYETAESKYNASLGSNNNTGIYSQNQKEFLFPAITDKGNDSKLSITKVKLEKNFTIVDFIAFNNRKSQYCGIKKDSYLYADGKKYQLLKAEGIAYTPNHTEFPNYESGSDVSLSFTLFFSPLPENTKSFDFIEPSYTSTDGDGWNDGEGWKLRGVKLDNYGWININSEVINTSSHNWQCLAIQLQDGQTILKKKVTPKGSGTYMYSDHDEFIEDADTGRKYYLRNSSISFKSSPLISYDTNPIEFAEVYPALPISVKRINISSGTQYYIKNLQIR